MIGFVNTRYWKVASCTYRQLLEEMEAWRKAGERGRYMCFCDAMGLAKGWRLGELRHAYRKADVVLADGEATKVLAKISGGNLPDRVIGPYLFPDAMEYGVKLGWRHYFYGTNKETLDKLKAQMEAKYPGIQIVGTYAPEYSPDPKPPTEALREKRQSCEAEAEIRQRNQAEAEKRQSCEAEAEKGNSLPASSAASSSLPPSSASAFSPSLPLPDSSACPSASFCDFFWVGLGNPKQEIWCMNHAKEIDAVACLPVGAAFDFYSGTVPHAPDWVHKIGCRWLWRLLTGGKRTFKRNAWCVPRAALILTIEFVRVRILRRPVASF